MTYLAYFDYEADLSPTILIFYCLIWTFSKIFEILLLFFISYFFLQVELLLISRSLQSLVGRICTRQSDEIKYGLYISIKF